MIDVVALYAGSPADHDSTRTERSHALAAAMLETFQGRDDCYALRRLSADKQRKFYNPACGARRTESCRVGKGVRNPCDGCDAAQLLPLTEAVLRGHVDGSHVVGLYLARDDKVRCAVVDFDDHSHNGTPPDARETPLIRAVRLIDAATRLEVPLLLERSGGGRGFHVWAFFAEWTPAAKAIALMTGLLAAAELPPDVEVFPRQKKVRKLGNLIALPWQDGPPNWRQGRSVFVDPDDTDVILDPLKVCEAATENRIAADHLGCVLKATPARKTVVDLAPVDHATDDGEVTAPDIGRLVERPIDAIFDGCEALRALRDDDPYDHAPHGRLHVHRMALASVLRLFDGGPEVVHAILRRTCSDYDATITAEKIGSFSAPPARCFWLQREGICPRHDMCPPMRDRGGRSPAVHAYIRGHVPADIDDGRPVVHCTTELREVWDNALAALAEHPDVYVRGANLCYVDTTRHSPQKSDLVKREKGTPMLALVKPPWIAMALTDVAQFVKFNAKAKGWTPSVPPASLVNALYEPVKLPGIRRLAGITGTPQMRPDGTMIDRPGYDTATELIYLPTQDIPPPPPTPSRDDALAALAELREVVREFPFKNEEAFAAWLSYVMTCFVRPAIDGSTPMFVIDANVRSAGKSLLAQVGALIAIGRHAPIVGWTEDDTEVQKKLTALFIAGDELICFDNIEKTIGGSSLNRALTGQVWNERVLGETRMTGNLPIRTVMVATSNNASFGNDVIRRIIYIRLESEHERPEDRKVDRPRLRNWVLDHRPRLVRACLTILAAYHHAGAPQRELLPMSDYDAWTQRVRQLVAWLGLPDPLLTQRELADDSDADASELSALITSMEAANPDGEWLGASEYLSRALQGKPSLQDRGRWDGEPLRVVLTEYLPVKGGGMPTAKSFGWRLRHYRDRVCSGASIRAKNDQKGMMKWRISRILSENTEGEI